MANPKVSVIVPIYKVEKYLVQCIDSIVNQTLKDIEIILVDEGDTDTCRFIIDHYEQTDNRVKTIHEKNGGYGASVNKGFDIATGEYISIIESDDFIAPTMFEEMYEYAKKLDADVVKVPYYEYFDKTEYSDEQILLCSGAKLTEYIPQDKLFGIEEYSILCGVHPSIWAALYKTDYLKRKNIKCIEAKGAGYVDNHFRLQTLCQTNRIAWLNKPFNYYRLTNPNASVALYNLSCFIKRWNDVHKLINEKFPEKWGAISANCIVEEWVNVYMRVLCERFTVTKEDIELIKENLKYITEEQIRRTTGLNRKSKNKLIKVLKNPNILNRYIRKVERKRVIRVLGFIVLNKKYVKSKTYMIYLFNILPIFKLKIRPNNKKDLYMFGFLPIARCCDI